MKCRETSFMEKLSSLCAHQDVLEIGCGDGNRLRAISQTLRHWVGIDPDIGCILKSDRRTFSSNSQILAGTAESLPFAALSFGAAIFTLSFHHVPVRKMQQAISEVVRVIKNDGHIIFLEPTPAGTFFEAEIRFGCCDGDEREKMAAAFQIIKTSQQLHEVCEFTDLVYLEYESFQDFSEHEFIPARSKNDLKRFLQQHNYRLSEKRRMNVFRKSVMA
jgi:ubiquinone/menaquinone biosynthesis C-methylase UbiE